MARIAMVTSSFIPRVGGVEEHVAHVALEMRDRGHDVSIWSVDRGDDVPSHFHSVPIRYLPCPLPSADAVRIAQFSRSLRPAARAWSRAMDADQPDIMHIHCFGPNGIYGAHWARRREVPLIYSNHGETFMDADDVFARSWILRSRLRSALSSAAAVTSCSRFAAEDLRRFGTTASPIRVVPNGVDMKEDVGQLPPELRDRTYILGLGRLVRQKGFDALLDAYALLDATDSTDGCVLVIGGTGPEANSLQRRAEHLGITHKVHFLGALSRATVGAVMSSARALVVPSQVEAFGITILEGWRAGIPVISTDRGGPPEFLIDGVNGLLVDPFSPGDIAAAIGRIVSSQPLASALGVAGRSAVTAFTWKAVADLYEDLYVAPAEQSAVRE